MKRISYFLAAVGCAALIACGGSATTESAEEGGVDETTEAEEAADSDMSDEEALAEALCDCVDAIKAAEAKAEELEANKDDETDMSDAMAEGMAAMQPMFECLGQVMQKGKDMGYTEAELNSDEMSTKMEQAMKNSSCADEMEAMMSEE